MSTRKPVVDPDIQPEYDFRDAAPNPYAERYPEGRAVIVAASGGSLGPTAGRARAARVRGATLIVSLVDGRELRVPIRWFPRLLAGSPTARANLRITGGGRAIRWPDLDQDIGVESLLSTAGS